MKCRNCNSEFESDEDSPICPECISQVRKNRNANKEQAIRVACPGCGKVSSYREKHIGRKTHCKQCELKFRISREVQVETSPRKDNPKVSSPVPIASPIEPPKDVVSEPTPDRNEFNDGTRKGMLLGALLATAVFVVLAGTIALVWLFMVKSRSQPVAGLPPAAERVVPIVKDEIDNVKNAIEEPTIEPVVTESGPRKLDEEILAELSSLLTNTQARNRRRGIELLEGIEPEVNDRISSWLIASLDPEFWGEHTKVQPGFGGGGQKMLKPLFFSVASKWISDQDMGSVIRDFDDRTAVGKGNTNLGFVLRLLGLRAPLDSVEYGEQIQGILRQGLSDNRNTKTQLFYRSCRLIRTHYPEAANPLLMPILLKSRTLSEKAWTILECFAETGDQDSIVALVEFKGSMRPVGFIERSGLKASRNRSQSRDKLIEEIGKTISAISTRMNLTVSDVEEFTKLAKRASVPVGADEKNNADFRQLNSITPYKKYAYDVNINGERNGQSTGKWDGRVFFQVRPPLSSYFTDKGTFQVKSTLTGFVIPKNQILVGLDRIDGATKMEVEIDGKTYPATLHRSHEQFGIAILKYTGPEVSPPKVDAIPVISETDSFIWTDPEEGDVVASVVMGRNLKRRLDIDIAKGIVWKPFYANKPEHNGGITLRPLGNISGFVFQSLNRRKVPLGSRTSTISSWTSTRSYISQRPSEAQLSPRSGRLVVAPISSLFALFRDANGELEEGLFDLNLDPPSPVHESNMRLQEFRKHVALVKVERPMGSMSKVSLASHADLKFTRGSSAANETKFLMGHGRDLEKQGLLEVSALRQTGKRINLPLLLGTLDDLFLCHYESGKDAWEYEQRVAISQSTRSARFIGGGFSRRNVNSEEKWQGVSKYRRGVEKNDYKILKEDGQHIHIERNFELVSSQAGVSSGKRNVGPALKFSGIQIIEFNKQSMLIENSNLTGSIEVAGESTNVQVTTRRLSRSETDQVMFESRYRKFKPPQGLQVNYPQKCLSDIDLTKLRKDLLGINAPRIRIALDKLATVVPNQDTEMSLLFAKEYFARFSQFGVEKLAQSWILPEHIPILVRTYQNRDTEDERFPPHQMMADFLEYHRPTKEIASEIFLAALNQKGRVDNTFRILRTCYYDIVEDVLLSFIKARTGSRYTTRRAIEMLGELGTSESLGYLKVEAYKKTTDASRNYNGPMQQAKQKIERRIKAEKNVD